MAAKVGQGQQRQLWRPRQQGIRPGGGRRAGMWPAVLPHDEVFARRATFRYETRMTIETILEDDRWDALGLDALAIRAANAVLRHLSLPAEGFEISLMGCDDARIATLNADFRGKPQPTNVLSWPADELAAEDPGGTPAMPDAGSTDMPTELGDIAIAYDTCLREAEAADTPMADHVSHLLVHGVLHLLGYDHIRDEDAELMEGLEVQILALLGQGNPYRVD